MRTRFWSDEPRETAVDENAAPWMIATLVGVCILGSAIGYLLTKTGLNQLICAGIGLTLVIGLYATFHGLLDTRIEKGEKKPYNPSHWQVPVSVALIVVVLLAMAVGLIWAFVYAISHLFNDVVAL